MFASLLRHRTTELTARTFYHHDPADNDGPHQFENASHSEIWMGDAGWRPNTSGTRGLIDKLRGQAVFRRTVRQIVEDARRWRPDIVYSSQQGWDCWAASAIADALQIPQVVHLHYTIDRNPPNNPIRRHPNERIKKVAAVFAVSEFIRQEAVEFGVPSQRVHVLRNSVDVPPRASEQQRREVRKELSIQEDAVLVGTVARVEWWKGQEATMRAVASLKTPNIRYAVVGDGSHLPRLKQLAAELQIADKVVFTGRRADARKLLWGFDIFSHPARHEPFGLAVAEASAAALPVTAFRHGGIPEIVLDGETGLLTPLDDVEALAESIRRLAHHADLRKKLGEAGRVRMEQQFRPQDAGTQFCNTIACILAGTENEHTDQRHHHHP